ncbi:MAG: hypothetical protein ACYTGB_19930 [Planctomycetota bacterium]|jgi:hypothetical protein
MAVGDPYGRWRLSLLVDLSALAWRRLAGAVPAGGAGPKLRHILASALRRKRAMLARAFPGLAAPPVEGKKGQVGSLLRALSEVEAAWAGALAALADDNELYVPRHDADGNEWRMSELAGEYILDDAELAGLVEAACGAGQPAHV